MENGNEKTITLCVGGRGSGKTLEMTERFQELEKIHNERPPNYRKVGCCASCDCFKEHPPFQTMFLVGFSWCDKFQTTVLPSGLCDEYEED